MNLTRRAVFGIAMAASAVAVPENADSQETAPPDWVAVSAENNRRNAEALSKIAVPQATEPAFAFTV